jgi:hypothetical protein
MSGKQHPVNRNTPEAAGTWSYRLLSAYLTHAMTRAQPMAGVVANVQPCPTCLGGHMDVAQANALDLVRAALTPDHGQRTTAIVEINGRWQAAQAERADGLRGLFGDPRPPLDQDPAGWAVVEKARQILAVETLIWELHTLQRAAVHPAQMYLSRGAARQVTRVLHEDQVAHEDDGDGIGVLASWARRALYSSETALTREHSRLAGALRQDLALSAWDACQHALASLHADPPRDAATPANRTSTTLPHARVHTPTPPAAGR